MIPHHIQDITSYAHPVIFDSDKKQKFEVSDNGEFIDTVYREQESNKLFGKLIGRNYVQPNAKKVFTTSDIVAESYLYKKGSWLKNWKKRYFILRKDIRSLCYYHSREDLTLLGTIPLDLDTQVSNVKQADADGFDHCIAMQTEHEDGSTSVTYIRFDSFEKMKAWMIDIKNEATNMRPAGEEATDGDYWAALFQRIDPLEIRSNAVRRDGQTQEIDMGKRNSRPQSGNSKSPVPIAPSSSGGRGQQAPGSNVSSPATSCALTSNESNSSTDDSAMPSIQALKLAAAQDSDDDSEPEEGSAGAKQDGANGRSNSRNKDDQQVAAAVEKKSVIRPTTSITVLKQTGRKMKTMKPDKPYGPPPFESPTVDRFQTADGALAGYQLSLRLCNVCGYQDKIFVVVFGSVATDKRITGAVDTKSSAGGANATSGGSKWMQLSRTEVRAVTDRPEYGENYVHDFKISFGLLQETVPETCKDIKIAVYRLDNEMNPREPGKATNLNMQLEIARSIVPRKLFVEGPQSVLKVAMQVKIELPMDIAIPLFKESEVTLGVVKLSSQSLQQQRLRFNEALHCKPYAERLYSFNTNTGQTLSLEQLYASRYAVGVAQALLSLWHQEQHEYLAETLHMLREEFSATLKEQEPVIRANLVGNETVDEKVSQLFEPYRQAIEVVDEVFNGAIENSSVVLGLCANAERGLDLMNNVLSPAVGGGVLRRSVWKKITAWQYCTTNLNVHLLTSRHRTFQELATGATAEHSPMHFIPSMTLGVPAAHELKFHDGGLRRIFGEILDTDQKLRWLQAFQAPTLNPLKALFHAHGREAQSLFGTRFLLSTKEDLAAVLKRKTELARRIEICGSQALGCAITCVKTVCMLAAQAGGGRFMDILARSLRIGFLVMFQSLLSTQGDELGMIEDMDIAVLWLSLVTLRLVRNTSNGNEATDSNSSEGSAGHGGGKRYNAKGTPIYVGVGEGITCRRDRTGRLIVDLELTEAEADAVLEAHRYMAGFDQRPIDVLHSVPFGFRTDPVVDYSLNETPPTVLAVAELFGVAFTQGVNEMQTLANLSSSREVTRQVEINLGSLARFVTFYRSYKAALEFQLAKRTPELIDILSANAAAAQGNLVNGSAVGVSGSSSATTPPPSGVRARRKTLRSSVSMFAIMNNNDEGLAKAADALKAKVLHANDRMLDQIHEAVAASTATPHEKHVGVLLKTSALCREIGGTVGILCKSGKDRTSMGVTLETTRSLAEELGVLGGQEVCQTMRQQGVRRMNVYANTGQSMFAFNQIQRIALPNCFRPPPGSHAGNVTS